MHGIERKDGRCSSRESDEGINMMADVEIKILPNMQHCSEGADQTVKTPPSWSGFTDSKQYYVRVWWILHYPMGGLFYPANFPVS